MKAAALFVSLAMAAPAVAQSNHEPGELMERLRATVDARLTSTKSPSELELCVADAVSRFMTPSVIRDGTTVHVVGWGDNNTAYISVSLRPTASATEIELRVRGNFTERLSARVRVCG